MNLPAVYALQTNLNAKGFNCGNADGDFGPKTLRSLMAFGAGKPMNQRMLDLARQMVVDFPKYQIDSRLRIVHFLAQAAHESGGFYYTQEIWGPTKAQAAYEGRADLGNTQPGDGYLFRGRGIFQLTGRANYRTVGADLSLPLESDPDMVLQPDVSVDVACRYWQHSGCAQWADADDVLAVSRIVNLGSARSTRTPNGLDDRTAILGRLKRAWVV